MVDLHNIVIPAFVDKELLSSLLNKVWAVIGALQQVLNSIVLDIYLISGLEGHHGAGKASEPWIIGGPTVS